MAMPEKITAFSVSPLKSGGYWSTAPQPPMEAIDDYIRADLVDELVAALEPFATIQISHPQQTERVVPVDWLRRAHDALARIKGDGK